MTSPILVVFYGGGRRPHALKCAMRDYGDGLCGEPRVVDRGAIWTMRSKMVTHFLEHTDAEWTLHVDGDMQWREDLIPNLGAICCETKGIVGAVVSKDTMGGGLATALPSGHHEGLGDGSQRSVETPGAIGSPMAIHRKALEQIIDQLGVGADVQYHSPDHLTVYRCSDLHEEYWSLFTPMVRWSDEHRCWLERADDASFCERAQAAGVSTRVAYGPRVAHWGEYPFDFRDGLGLK